MITFMIRLKKLLIPQRLSEQQDIAYLEQGLFWCSLVVFKLKFLSVEILSIKNYSNCRFKIPNF